MQVQDEPSLEKPSLYDRLGGVYNIATVVDDLIDRCDFLERPVLMLFRGERIVALSGA